MKIKNTTKLSKEIPKNGKAYSPIGAGLNKQFKSIPITAISERKNYRTGYTQLGINELSENISSHGLINPILVRPVKTGYEIVAGHRRYEAVCLLGWKEIDCAVIDISEDEAFEYSVIENLQREDVHPMDEAKAFQLILKNSTIPQLAKRVNRSESYIARRLKLNDLTKEAVNDFYDGHLELAHCVELCRLTKEQQKECLERITENEGYGKDRVTYYESPVRLKAIIQRDILRKLSAAPFKKDDPDLYKKAGACTECPKRSGANQYLFNDIESGDMCFDDKCYEIKIEIFLNNKIKELEDNGYDFYLLSDKYSVTDEIKKKYPGKKIITYTTYGSNNFNIIKKESKDSFKGIFIDGPERGHVKNIEIKKDKTSGNHNITEAAENLPPKLQIEKINQRLERAVEIDRGKVFERLSYYFEDSGESEVESTNRIVYYDSDKIVKDQPVLSDVEEELFYYALYERGGMYLENIFELLLQPGNPKMIITDFGEIKNIREKIKKLDESDKRQIKRMLIKNIIPVNMISLESNEYLYERLVELSKQFNPVQTKNILASQEEIRRKRENNAAAKIKLIKNNKS